MSGRQLAMTEPVSMSLRILCPVRQIKKLLLLKGFITGLR
jgi:hypothetical protein